MAVIENGSVVTSGQTVTELTLINSTISGSGLTIRGVPDGSSVSHWTSGRFVGAGALTVGMYGVLDIHGSGVHDLKEAWHIVNEGRVIVSHSFWCDAAAGLVNNGELTLEYAEGEIGGCVLTNGPTGIIRKVGSGTSIVRHLESQGYILVEQGTLQPWQTSTIAHADVSFAATLEYWTGTHAVATGGTVTGDGMVLLTGGTLENSGTIDGDLLVISGSGAGGTLSNSGTIDVLDLDLGGGAISGGGTVQFRREMRWSTGRMTGTGTTLIPPGATMFVQPGGARDLRDTRRLVNRGTLLAGSSIWCDAGVTFRNESEMVLHQPDQSIGNCPLRNVASGTLRKTGGGVATLRNLDSQGRVFVEVGILSLPASAAISHAEIQLGATLLLTAGTALEVATGGSLTGDGKLRLEGGTVTNLGDLDIQTLEMTGGNLVLSSNAAAGWMSVRGGTLSGSSRIDVSERFEWSTGRMDGTGTLKVGPEAELEIQSGGARDLRDRWRFINEGTGRMAASVFCSNTVLFENRGALEVTYTSGQLFACPLMNADGATLRKTGTGTSSVYRLDSTGDVVVESGALFVDRESHFRGSTVIHQDGVLALGFGPNVFHESGVVSGTGTVAFGTGQITNRARFEPGLSTGTLHVDGMLPCDAPLTLGIEVGGEEPEQVTDLLDVSDRATLCGSLEVTALDGFDPYTEATYTIARFASRSGTFGTVSLPDFPGADLSVEYTDTTVVLRVGPASGQVLTILDAMGDPVPETELELRRLTSGRPTFDSDLLGAFVTDASGRFLLPNADGGGYVLPASPVNSEEDRLQPDDQLLVTREVYRQPAFKHAGIHPTAWSVHLDNQRVLEDGSIGYDTLRTEPSREITLGHSEFRFDLVVGVEWDADGNYLNQVVEGLRDVSNYLYDVTDTQARLGHVVLFDNDSYEFFHAADLQILAHSGYRASAYVNGYSRDGLAARMPRKAYRALGQTRTDHSVREQAEFLGALALAATCPEPSEPEGHVQCEDYRIKAHELGHYLLGFGDEYEPLTGGRCEQAPGTPMQYGFMDHPHAVTWEEGALAYSVGAASETSSESQYVNPDCRNTDQWEDHGMSTWEQWEAHEDTRGEGYYCPEGRHDTRMHPEDLFVPIVRPQERSLPLGSVWLDGPNDLHHALGRDGLDYAVGDRLTAEIHDSSTLASTVDVVAADGMDRVTGADVYTRPKSALPARMEQGPTAVAPPYEGRMFVMGAAPGDEIAVEKRDLEIGDVAGTVSWRWRSGRTTVTDAEPISLEAPRTDGWLPALSRLGYDAAGSIEHRLEVESLWPSIPEYELEAPGSRPTAVAYSQNPTAYTAVFGADPPAEGAITVRAKDAQGDPFFFSVRYAHEASLSPESRARIRTPDGASELMIPAGSHSVQRVLLSNTQYPPKRASIGAQALPVGPIVTVATYPASASLPAGTTLTHRFAGLDLVVDGSLRGTVESLGMYRWSDGRSEWEDVGGTLDRTQDEFEADVTDPGVYAVFATALNVFSEPADGKDGVLPGRVALDQNYPNPFNPSTTIRYHLDRTSRIDLEVLDLLGRTVVVLESGMRETGVHEVSLDAGDLPSGVYFCRLRSEHGTATRKMVLAR